MSIILCLTKKVLNFIAFNSLTFDYVTNIFIKENISIELAMNANVIKTQISPNTIIILLEKSNIINNLSVLGRFHVLFCLYK